MERFTMKEFLFAMLLLLLLFPSNQNHRIWIEIHDVSPGYGVEELDRALNIIKRHHVDRTVLFVIPNRDEREPISEYPEFTDYLKEREKEGFIIGAHGFSHRGAELYCSRERALDIVEKVEREFKKSGFEVDSFYPPRYLTTKESLEVLKQNYEVYLLSRIVSENGSLPSFTYEFTFGLDHRIILPVAKFSYLKTGGEVFRLSLHMGSIDEEALIFLDEFLDWTDGMHPLGERCVALRTRNCSAYIQP
jgi:hypothetical protein